MTDSQATHPLDRLTAGEIRHNRSVLAQAGLVGPDTRFPLVQLHEPPKSEVLAFTGDAAPERQVFSVLLDTATGACAEAVVSLTQDKLVRRRDLDPAAEGQPPIMIEEYALVDAVVKADPAWRAAMARRGVTDLELACPCPLSAGDFDLPGERGRRLLRVLTFVKHRPEDHPWAHPVDGLVAYVDLIERRVVELLDHRLAPVPQEEGNFDDESFTGPARTTLKPLEITQPEGPSFTVEGDVVEWENWRLRLGFDPREGLVLHQVTFRDGDRERPILYRASIAEMVVPYADPAPARFWQNYFDAGEYSLGKMANSLVLGCDCLGEITYLDAVLADDHGEPYTIENAICLHEEDQGVLWKHSDLFTGSAETRRSRRLVVSYFATVGNYDYGFYWHLYLDGGIRFECKSTGVLFTSAYEDGRYASEVAPGLGAPLHQHLFCARLDMMVDGVTNAVDEVELARVGPGEGNPYGNAFTTTATRLRTEAEAARLAAPASGRSWQVSNPAVANRLGRPVAYALVPQGRPTLLADGSSSIARRAAFATKHLWVTRYDPAERYPAGDYVNQSRGQDGLPAWVARDRDLDGADVVLWHTFGITHVPRPEDWPVMPAESCGFTLRPVGFFDRNPALDLPKPGGRHCG
ncbi:primary-amine oxidase [Nonomuraea sp. SYSU D8015]|uniref:primary-amine oxidase n=1 Tax=Nonomuraea sp. SYSU D8015 TaxID=2593644 RepID=UPI0016603AEA|nr:primary-amine oxidase [Nonomuraea sp. SYSU D8015]